MTEIERKALALLRECAEVPAYVNLQAIPGFVRAALFRAIKQHEALEAENERLLEKAREWAIVVREADKQWSQPLSTLLEQLATALAAMQEAKP